MRRTEPEDKTMGGERIVLIHWNESEGHERLEGLAREGFRTKLHAEGGSAALRRYRSSPPDAFVIDITRLPAQGRDVGIWLRQQGALRHLPLVFVGGMPAQAKKVQVVLPDATFCDWHDIAHAIRGVMKRPIERPVVPGTMAGYSGTPLIKKLGIKPDSTVALLGAPESFDQTLGELPDGVQVRRRAQGRSGRVLLFARSAKDLSRRVDAAARAVAEGGALWLIWPKKSSGVVSDLDQGVIRKYGLDRGFVDYKICAVDEVWSGLLFTRRR
jgi:hypothetical protein